MKAISAFWVTVLAIGVSSCVSTGPAPDIYLGGGLGSEFGNFDLQPAGQTILPTGERCVVFHQDRPFSAGYVLRVTTESCGSPARMECREISRNVVPMSRRGPQT